MFTPFITAHAIMAIIAFAGSQPPKSSEYRSCLERAESEVLARHGLESADPLYKAVSLNSFEFKDAQFKVNLAKCYYSEEFAKADREYKERVRVARMLKERDRVVSMLIDKGANVDIQDARPSLASMSLEELEGMMKEAQLKLSLMSEEPISKEIMK